MTTLFLMNFFCHRIILKFFKVFFFFHKYNILNNTTCKHLFYYYFRYGVHFENIGGLSVYENLRTNMNTNYIYEYKYTNKYKHENINTNTYILKLIIIISRNLEKLLTRFPEKQTPLTKYRENITKDLGNKFLDWDHNWSRVVGDLFYAKSRTM